MLARGGMVGSEIEMYIHRVDVLLGWRVALVDGLPFDG